MNKQRIILVGPMGAGKSSVGLQLSKMLGIDFVDSDQAIIQHDSASMSQIITKHGEAYFRKQETRILQANLHQKSLIFATGGGGILAAENRRIIKRNFWVCYLRVSPGTQMQRLQAVQDRPLLPSDPVLRYAYLVNTQQQRAALYAEVASITIVTDTKTIDDITKQVYAATQETACID